MSDTGENQAIAGKGGVVPPAEHRWKPGESGNPAGRPKSRPITAAIKEMLDKDDGKALKALAAVGVKNALKGDVRFWTEVMSRIDGKVPDSLDITTDGESLREIPGLSPEEVAEFHRWRAEKAGVE